MERTDLTPMAKESQRPIFVELTDKLNDLSSKVFSLSREIEMKVEELHRFGEEPMPMKNNGNDDHVSSLSDHMKANFSTLEASIFKLRNILDNLNKLL